MRPSCSVRRCAAVLIVGLTCLVPRPAAALDVPTPSPPDTPGLAASVNEALVQAAERAKAAVVNISSTLGGPAGLAPAEGLPFGPVPPYPGAPLPPGFPIPPEMGLGSGVLVTPDGYIITNNHVVEGAQALDVLLPDKRRFTATVIGTDPPSDLALIKIDGTDLPSLPWGDSSRLRAGELVMAVGNPFGLNQTVTVGVVSAVGRANIGIVDYEDFIQTDAAINPGNPGNSGGALVNLRGELVGINTAIVSPTGGFMGIGFAIPSKMARTVMASSMKQGKVIRGWLGLGVQDLSIDLAKDFGLREAKGALVSDLLSKGPAMIKTPPTIGSTWIGSARFESRAGRPPPVDFVRARITREAETGAGRRQCRPAEPARRLTDDPRSRHSASSAGGHLDGPDSARTLRLSLSGVARAPRSGEGL
ncbi:trypsin-like peptidase domain-containing protein [Candidatus Nitrospira bockiana]